MVLPSYIYNLKDFTVYMHRFRVAIEISCLNEKRKERSIQLNLRKVNTVDAIIFVYIKIYLLYRSSFSTFSTFYRLWFVLRTAKWPTVAPPPTCKFLLQTCQKHFSPQKGSIVFLFRLESYFHGKHESHEQQPKTQPSLVFVCRATVKYISLGWYFQIF